MPRRFKRRAATPSEVDKVHKTIKTDRGELYGVQMLRALAALAVVTHHTLEQSNGARHRFSPDWLTTSGASGVDIFFVISGFIIAIGLLAVTPLFVFHPDTSGLPGLMIITSIIVALLAHLIVERPLLATARVLTHRQRRPVVSLP